jgi:hypothetical protein
MAIKIGYLSLIKRYLGKLEVIRTYLGNILVFESSFAAGLLSSFKTRVINESSVFEAEDCLKTDLKTLESYQVDPNAQIVRDYASRVRADGGTVEGFESTINSVKKSTDQELYDRAILSLFPSGAKAGKAYSILPTNGNGDFDVVRSTTKTRTNRLGLIETVEANVPSLNYDSVGGTPSLLLEPQRTNLVAFSNDFTKWDNQQYWSITNSISPEGIGNAQTITFTASNQFSQRGTSLATGVICSSSIFVKGVLNETIIFNAGGIDQVFTFTGNWQRLRNENKTSTNSSITFSTYGNVSGRSFQAYGGQLEQASFVSSYIPTSGSAVTRNRDTLSKTGISDLINSREGVLFLEIAALSNGGSFMALSLSDGTFNNEIAIKYRTQSNEIWFIARKNNANVFLNQQYNIPQNNLNKIAIKYSITQTTVWLIGVKIATLNPILFSENLLNSILFNEGGEFFSGKVNGLQLYKTALTDAECITLTS